jgi:hypothetical protein
MCNNLILDKSLDETHEQSISRQTLHKASNRSTLQTFFIHLGAQDLSRLMHMRGVIFSISVEQFHVCDDVRPILPSERERERRRKFIEDEISVVVNHIFQRHS